MAGVRCKAAHAADAGNKAYGCNSKPEAAIHRAMINRVEYLFALSSNVGQAARKKCWRPAGLAPWAEG